MFGIAKHESGSNYGGYFLSSSDAGIGIYAEGETKAGLFEGDIEVHTLYGDEVILGLKEGTGFGFDLVYNGEVDGLQLWSRMFSGNEASRMTWKKNGFVGIGTNAPTEALDVNGNVHVEGSVFASCGTLSCSDARYKVDVMTLTHTLSKLKKLRAVRFKWDHENFPAKQFKEGEDIGIIAQELEAQFPKLVHIDEDGFRTVAYDKLSSVLLQGILELSQELEKGKNRYQKLQEKQETMQGELSDIRSLLRSSGLDLD